MFARYCWLSSCYSFHDQFFIPATGTSQLLEVHFRMFNSLESSKLGNLLIRIFCFQFSGVAQLKPRWLILKSLSYKKKL